MWDVFEQPWTLVGVAVFALVVVWVIKITLAKKSVGRLFFVPLFIAMLGFGLDYFVATDSEQIRGVIQRASDAVEKEDAALLEPLLCADYRDSIHRSKESVIKYFRDHLKDPVIEQNIANVETIDFSDKRASVVFTVRVVFEDQSLVAQNYKKMLFVKARADMQKEEKGWLIKSIELTNLDLQPVRWKDIRQYNW